MAYDDVIGALRGRVGMGDVQASADPRDPTDAKLAAARTAGGADLSDLAAGLQRSGLPLPVKDSPLAKLWPAYNAKAEPGGIYGGDPTTAALMMAQAAYHGTPHAWEGPGAPLEAAKGKTFDLSKMGTGEGAQAYGWGAYATKEPQVAENYRDALTHVRADFAPGVEWEAAKNELVRRLHAEADRLWDSSRPDFRAGDSLKSQQTRRQAAFNEGSGPDVLTPNAIRGVGDMYGVNVDDLVPRPEGRLYKLEAPEDSEMLHYDKPLSEQPEAVQKRLKDAGLWPEVKTAKDFPTRPGEVASRSPNGWLIQPGESVVTVGGNVVNRAKPGLDPASVSGRDFYHYLHLAPNVPGTARTASEVLNTAGIPGHLYRGDSSGVENMVIYDPARAPVVDAYRSLKAMLSRKEE